MKTKNFSKKLTLSKKTISNLDQKEMKRIQGGTSWASCNKYTYCIDCYD